MTSCFLFLVAVSILIPTSTIVVMPFSITTTTTNNNIAHLPQPSTSIFHSSSCSSRRRSSVVGLAASTGNGDGNEDDKRNNRNGGVFTNVQKFFRRFTQRASVSHILLKCDDGTAAQQLANQLEDWKVDIDDSPVKFAEYAARYSECPSSSSGGDLGEFGPGTMVKPFNDVVFDKNDDDESSSSSSSSSSSPSSSYLYDVGVVHGPIRTQFGYHLIYIRDRTE
eukprot:CAMPEP_0113466140 /NCGR_PEP_ID=MMETSP0014_2-20120614/14112_1 /TAXON_ID=2857 /ORGANISM="Nitzschia sp." /LENGTH=222 /DNA_ID=CAMNT_0000358341 /DNA_START=989 /DNA_END=1657 /DNA_ORIENTATION=- /assembly_acc=CAM_ASM_000159